MVKDGAKDMFPSLIELFRKREGRPAGSLAA